MIDGAGLTLIDRLSAQAFLTPGVVLRPLCPERWFEFGIIRARDGRLSPLAEAFATCLRDEIERRGASLERQLDELNAMRAAGQIEQYNAAVPGYNQQVEAYRAQVNRFNADVARLNRLIEEHNALALAKRELYDAMDSRL